MTDDPASPIDYRGRGERLAEIPASRELDQLLITDLVNIRWLTGFTGTNAACVAGADTRLFLTDFRYAERAGSIEGWEVEIVRGEWLKGIAERLAGRVGVEGEHITLSDFERLRKQVAGDVELSSSPGAVEGLRRVKSRFELDAIGDAAELTDSIYREIMEQGLAGRTEAAVARFAVARMREQGAEPSFPPIIASGPNGASPHAEPAEREIRPGELVTIDMGSELDGYCSDCTRTFVAGKEPDLDGFAREIYDVTLEAQLAGLDAIRAGAEGSAVDAVARAVIEDAGYGDRFGHGLGHGVGLEIHEAPRLGPSSTDTLVAGDVVTVEPGIYVSGRTGLRIEDMVAVGDDGIARNYGSISKELTFVG